VICKPKCLRDTIEMNKDFHCRKNPSDLSVVFSIAEPWNSETASKIPARTLAYIGDSVFELGMRLRHVKWGADKTGKLHDSVVDIVCAPNQARIFDIIFADLDEKEQNLLKNWRNTKLPYRSSPVPKGIFAKSTAFEAWVGFLFLTGQCERLIRIFALTLSEDKQNETTVDEL